MPGLDYEKGGSATGLQALERHASGFASGDQQQATSTGLTSSPAYLETLSR